MSEIGIVILAAGEGRRFGSVKQLAIYQGKPLLQRAVDTCLSIPGIPVYVVLGAQQKSIENTLDLSRTIVLENTQWREGLASSIRLSTEVLRYKYHALLFIAGDQVLVSVSCLAEMIDMWQQRRDRIVAAFYQGAPGIPAIFPRSFYSQLSALVADRGAKKLLLESTDDLATVLMPEAAVDIDTQADLAQLQSVLERC